MSNFFILSQPRSGSSMLANLINSAGYNNYISKNSSLLTGSSHNKSGYFEDIKLTLLNDQFIRALYGMDYSFLFPPSSISRIYNTCNFNENISNGFNYDITENTLLMPDKFEDDPSFYTGISWDIWGLTRMVEGGKWFNCYSKFNVSNKMQIICAKDELEKAINSSDNLVIKDPRLSLTMEIFNFSVNNNKIIFLERKSASTISSMKRHYGPNMFSSNFIKNTDLVSNHFNHKVKFLDYLEFSERYNYSFNLLERYPSIKISYDNLINKVPSEIKLLENFIESKVDLSLIHSP